MLVLLAVAQVVLPGIAAQHLRDRLARSGQVLSVSVAAFPALELLWHHADRVTVRLGRYRSTPGGLARLLNESANVDDLSASVARLDTGLLTLRNAALSKSGSILSGSALVTQSDLRTALPVLDSVTPVASAQGTLTLRGTATLFGVTASVDATVGERRRPCRLAAGSVRWAGHDPVFSDPRLAVSRSPPRRPRRGSPCAPPAFCTQRPPGRRSGGVGVGGQRREPAHVAAGRIRPGPLARL